MLGLTAVAAIKLRGQAVPLGEQPRSASVMLKTSVKASPSEFSAGSQGQLAADCEFGWRRARRGEAKVHRVLAALCPDHVDSQGPAESGKWHIRVVLGILTFSG